jgi:hypothetical protein
MPMQRPPLLSITTLKNLKTRHQQDLVKIVRQRLCRRGKLLADPYRCVRADDDLNNDSVPLAQKRREGN